mmetsp:Transcript_51663/g.89771  ORF Transcript_51663/g.89771 Transcript_51663/m.89771 type:complete len:150 (+) Transcript_51663:2-451(+)
MSVNTTITVTIGQWVTTARTSTTTTTSKMTTTMSPVCKKMTMIQCSSFVNLCGLLDSVEFGDRATCDFTSGFCACKPGFCSSGLQCELDTSGETASLSQMDREADTHRLSVEAAVMTVTVAVTILGVVASCVVHLTRRRQRNPLVAPLM